MSRVAATWTKVRSMPHHDRNPNQFHFLRGVDMATVDVAGSEPPSALREPLANASGGWITKWTLGSFGWLMPMYAAGQILLPKQATAVAGNNQETVLGVVTIAAAVMTIIVNIVVGALSDRTLA